MEDIMFTIFIVIFVIGFIVAITIFIINFITAITKKRGDNDYMKLENMPQEFKEIYNKLYSKNAPQLEELRKSVLNKYIIFGIVLLLVFVITISIIPEHKLDGSVFEAIVTIFLGIMLVFVILMQKYKKRYVQAYKHNIISKFVKLVNENLQYKDIEALGINARPDYINANFDARHFNRFFQDDYIEGKLENDVKINIFDIHIQNVVKRGKDTHVEEIFQGIFAKVISSKNIDTTVKISRNKLKILDSKNRIQMDSGEFEESFDVYANDKITAMRILTSDVMECLIDFKNKYKLDFEIVFKNNIIYARFFTGPMFEPKIIGNAMDESLIFRYYTILKFIIEITQTVNSTKDNLDI